MLLTFGIGALMYYIVFYQYDLFLAGYPFGVWLASH